MKRSGVRIRVNDAADRRELVGILAFAGYGVSIQEHSQPYSTDIDYYVIIEGVGDYKPRNGEEEGATFGDILVDKLRARSAEERG